MSLHRTLTTTVFAGLMALPVAALDLNQMTPQEREIFRQEVRSYLMDNPEVIMEAVNLLEERQQQAQLQEDFDLVTNNADAIFDDGFSFVGGNPDGDITLVEFLDYRCGYCKRAHAEVSKLLETDGNIRLIVKEFPILGEQSVLASRFAVATKQIAGNDRYKALNDALMTVNGDVTLPMLRRLGATLDLDTAAIEARMDSEDVTAKIAQTRDLAQKLRITGTPTFVLQDEMLRGYLPYDQMMALIKEKRN